MKFFSDEDYKVFNSKYQDCLFENTFGYESNEANKVKVYGKDFVGWANPGKADDSMWEDAEDDFLKSPGSVTPVRGNQDLQEEFEEAANGGIQSLALGALDNSFLVGSSGIQVVKNFSHGIHGKGAYVNFGSENHRNASNLGISFQEGLTFSALRAQVMDRLLLGLMMGKIRLYSINSMRQAKTAFPGLGSPITHVDVTFDGKWILGTTDTYLILICTLFTDKDGKMKTGFNGRMGNRIAAPRLLKLTPLDSHLAGVNNKFQKAQFSWNFDAEASVGSQVLWRGKTVHQSSFIEIHSSERPWSQRMGKQERHLVATAGKFSAIWNFQQVKNGSHECYRNQEGLKSCYCYKVVLKDDSIVDSRFMHDKFAVSDSPEAPLVIATPMKVSSFSISSRR
ncbi:hypothetical protein OIU78_011932 [Salix suchowensis]|nr:hypothetical protein OIU78_011932 [Salix suchowensis]